MATDASSASQFMFSAAALILVAFTTHRVVCSCWPKLFVVLPRTSQETGELLFPLCVNLYLDAAS